MILTEKQKKEFEEITKPVIKWLNGNCNLHTEITVEQTRAELKEGLVAFEIDEFIKD